MSSSRVNLMVPGKSAPGIHWLEVVTQNHEFRLDEDDDGA